MLSLHPSTHRKIRRVLLFLFTLHFTILFVHHGYLKFDPDGFWGPAFQRWGYPVWFLFFIGVVEVTGGIAILIPPIATYGAMLLAVNMLGALVTRLIHGISLNDVDSIVFYIASMLLLAYEFNPGRLRSRKRQEGGGGHGASREMASA